MMRRAIVVHPCFSYAEAWHIFYQQLKKYKLNLSDFDLMNELTSELSSIISQRSEEY